MSRFGVAEGFQVHRVAVLRVWGLVRDSKEEHLPFFHEM